MAGQGGVIGTILGWVGYQLGMRTDTASATGSLHAKTKDIKNVTSDIQDLVQDNLPTNCLKGSVTCSASTSEDRTTTLINLQNKKGKLHGITVRGTLNSPKDTVQIIACIILDGVSMDVIYYVRISPDELLFVPAGMEFRSSCKIDITTRLFFGSGGGGSSGAACIASALYYILP